MMDKLKGYKTLVFNVIMGALLGWKMLSPDAPEMEGVETMLNALLNNVESIITVIGNIILRFRTTTPIGKAA